MTQEDIKKIRKDFPWFNNNPKLCYLDNSATSLKPKCVIDAIVEYYEKFSCNPHNTDSLFTYNFMLLSKADKSSVFVNYVTHIINLGSNSSYRLALNLQQNIASKTIHLSF